MGAQQQSNLPPAQVPARSVHCLIKTGRAMSNLQAKGLSRGAWACACKHASVQPEMASAAANRRRCLTEHPEVTGLSGDQRRCPVVSLDLLLSCTRVQQEWSQHLKLDCGKAVLLHV